MAAEQTGRNDLEFGNVSEMTLRDIFVIRLYSGLVAAARGLNQL